MRVESAIWPVPSRIRRFVNFTRVLLRSIRSTEIDLCVCVYLSKRKKYHTQHLSYRALAYGTFLFIIPYTLANVGIVRSFYYYYFFFPITIIYGNNAFRSLLFQSSRIASLPTSRDPYTHVCIQLRVFLLPLPRFVINYERIPYGNFINSFRRSRRLLPRSKFIVSWRPVDPTRSEFPFPSATADTKTRACAKRNK